MTEEYSCSGNRAGHAKPDMAYGLTFKSDDIALSPGKEHILIFSAWFLHDTLHDCHTALSINSGGENLYYKSYNLERLLRERNAWEQLYLSYYLPELTTGDIGIDFHIWNKGGNDIYYDDVFLRVY